mmetsp:Transcript_60765/g.166885  ORF Transcript_60765/g.166885 Transcript_60765/m.166885 type:complete len:339 (-) Transcript_60765:144-1160(-)
MSKRFIILSMLMSLITSLSSLNSRIRSVIDEAGTHPFPASSSAAKASRKNSLYSASAIMATKSASVSIVLPSMLGFALLIISRMSSSLISRRRLAPADWRFSTRLISQLSIEPLPSRSKMANASLYSAICPFVSAPTRESRKTISLWSPHLGVRRRHRSNARRAERSSLKRTTIGNSAVRALPQTFPVSSAPAPSEASEASEGTPSVLIKPPMAASSVEIPGSSTVLGAASIPHESGTKSLPTSQVSGSTASRSVFSIAKHRTTSELAMTVAHLGSPVMMACSPKYWPGPKKFTGSPHGVRSAIPPYPSRLKTSTSPDSTRKKRRPTSPCSMIMSPSE